MEVSLELMRLLQAECGIPIDLHDEQSRRWLPLREANSSLQFLNPSNATMESWNACEGHHACHSFPLWLQLGPWCLFQWILFTPKKLTPNYLVNGMAELAEKYSKVDK
jgi:hypothetical protein